MMEASDVIEIKRKIVTLKDKKARALGAMDNIKKRWKEEFACSSEEEVVNLIDTMNKEIAENTRRMNILLEKIEKAYPWETV